MYKLGINYYFLTVFSNLCIHLPFPSVILLWELLLDTPHDFLKISEGERKNGKDEKGVDCSCRFVLFRSGNQ